MNYDYSDTNTAEQYNTLLLLDETISKKNLNIVVTFHILGGTALLFHGMSSVSTIDIDVANSLSSTVKDIVEPFVSDNASEVATLAKNYKERLIPYKENEFKNLKVYLLSLEDLVITKLGAGRHKDFEDLKLTGIMQNVNYNLLTEIINNEIEDPRKRSNLMVALARLE